MKLAIIFAAVLCAVAVVSAENWTVESGDFVVEVTGNENVPKYTYYLTSNSTNKSKVFLHKIYEMSGGKKVGGTNVALPSLSWTFTKPASSNEECLDVVSNSTVCDNCNLAAWNASAPNATVPIECEPCAELPSGPDDECVCTTTEDDDMVSFTTVCNCTYNVYSMCNETSFNITNTAGPRWDELNFVNHLLNTTENSHLKIDIELYGYKFDSTDAEAQLVIEFSADLGDGTTLSDNSTFFRVGNSYISSEQWAAVGNTTVGVNMTTSCDSGDCSGSTDVQFVYDHFPDGETLIHDPTIGFVTKDDDPFGDEGSSSSDGWGTWTIVFIVVGSVAAVAVVGVIVAAAVVMVMKSRKSGYETVA
eukprot:TRINITY_DN15863_c0_g1_i1.p2 TRINITY_DN15863_c0_g1~~TRINITY_DN15863_c0_g1_i1.p2  ORF type:complete len:383 (-),score=142.33 TRINITY_DN15863_c0_g1_i1:219-1304(-)